MQSGLHITLSFVWLAMFWTLTRNRPANGALTLVGMIAAIVAVYLATPPLWIAVSALYPQDSYWTLSLFGRVGVAIISITGIAAITLMLATKTRWILRLKPRKISHATWAICDIAIGMIIFGVVYSVSPQIFYTFYQWVFAGLPQQWVIDTALNVAQLKKIAIITATGNLADHLAGVTLWAIPVFTLWLHWRHYRHTAEHI